MATAVVRIPGEVLEDAKRFSALHGESPGEVIARAWAEYKQRHCEELAGWFEDVAHRLRSGDTQGLLEFTAPGRRDRARRAAKRIRQLEPQLDGSD